MSERSDRSDEGGSTLIEVMIAVAILGIAVVTILGAMTTGMMASFGHRQQANAGDVLLSAVERVKTAPYVTCAAPTDYLSAAQGVTLPTGGGWTASAVAIPSISYWAKDGSFQATCPTTSPFMRLELVTVAVTSPDGATTEQLSVLKRG